MKKIFVLVMFLTCIISSLADAASLSAKVSRDTVIQGETLNLTLTYDGPQTNLQPDFAPLDENFNIFGVSSAYQHSNINGQISQKREWVAQLMPKKTGNLVIPALKLGNMKSNAVDIKVLEASPENMKHSEHNLQENSHRYAVEAEIDNLSPYVQQEVNMTIKVFDTGGLRVERIVPMVNDENNWVIRSLGEPKFESQVIDGHSVRVVKIKLALFPQKSGVLDSVLRPPLIIFGRAQDPGLHVERDGMKIGFQPYSPSPVLTGHLHLGDDRIGVTSRYLTRDGKPFIPVMGEYHFSRDRRERWFAELSKMRAGGITVVATYLFWIYHEEDEGALRFDGDLDIRAFVQTCQQLGLDVLLRIGPWAHGECRNGGFNSVVAHGYRSFRGLFLCRNVVQAAARL